MAVIRRGHTWRVQVTLGLNPKTGKRERRSWTFDSETEARDFEKREKAEQERLQQQHVRPSLSPLREYLDEWLRRKENEGLAARSLHDYRWCIQKRILPALGQHALADLSPALLQHWQDRLAPTKDTPGASIAAKAFRVLRSALGDAERLGMIPRNPARAVRPAQRTRVKRAGFTLGQAQAILRAAQGERLEPLFAFALHSGLRVAETLGLRWADVDLEAGILSVRRDMVCVGGRMVEGRVKNARSARTLALIPQAMEDLKRQRAVQARERMQSGPEWREEGWVFAALGGGVLNTANVDRAFARVRCNANKAACAAAGKDPGAEAMIPQLPLYSLRHASASILLGAGVPVAVAAKMMGHSVDMFTETYAELLLEATRDAAAKVGAFLDAHTPPNTEVVPIERARRGGRPRRAAEA